MPIVLFAKGENVNPQRKEELGGGDLLYASLLVGIHRYGVGRVILVKGKGRGQDEHQKCCNVLRIHSTCHMNL